MDVKKTGSFAALAEDFWAGKVKETKPTTEPNDFVGLPVMYYSDRDALGLPCKKTGGAR